MELKSTGGPREYLGSKIYSLAAGWIGGGGLGGVESDSEFSTRKDQEHDQPISWLGAGGDGDRQEELWWCGVYVKVSWGRGSLHLRCWGRGNVPDSSL